MFVLREKCLDTIFTPFFELTWKAGELKEVIPDREKTIAFEILENKTRENLGVQ